MKKQSADKRAVSSLDVRGAIAAYSHKKSNARAVTRLRCHSKQSRVIVTRNQNCKNLDAGAQLARYHLIANEFSFAGDAAGDHLLAASDAGGTLNVS